MCLLMSLWNHDFIRKIKTKSIGIKYPEVKFYPFSLKIFIFNRYQNTCKDQLLSELNNLYLINNV